MALKLKYINVPFSQQEHDALLEAKGADGRKTWRRFILECVPESILRKHGVEVPPE